MSARKDIVAIISLFGCLFIGLMVKAESPGKEYYSFDNKYFVYFKESFSNEPMLIISSVEKEKTSHFTKRDLCTSLGVDAPFKIDSVKWAPKGHMVMAVQISCGQSTDVLLIYHDDGRDQWDLVSLGPAIGYYDPTWVKEDKILVTYVGSEDEYGICVFNFERHSITYFVPYKGSIKYDCQGIVFQNGNETTSLLKYSQMNFAPQEPRISNQFVWLADETTLRKRNRFINKVAHFNGNYKRYLCGRDFCYFDFLGYSNVPVRTDFRKYVSYPMPTRNMGFAGLKDWTGYRYIYSFNDGFEYKGYEMATKRLEEISKKQESDLMVQMEVRPNEKKKVEIDDLQIEIKDSSTDNSQSHSHLEITIQHNKNSETISIGYIRSANDAQWWTPVVCVEKESFRNTRLLAVKYIDDSGLCTDIYAIDLK